MSKTNNHNADSVEDQTRGSRGRIPCWLAEFGKVIEAVAAGPRSRTNNRASELTNDHNVKSWFLG
jgi:hypothetical protein